MSQLYGWSIQRHRWEKCSEEVKCNHVEHRFFIELEDGSFMEDIERNV